MMFRVVHASEGEITDRHGLSSWALIRARAFRVKLMATRVLFFFKAEDGIGDSSVTGVQTCALPILKDVAPSTTLRRWFNHDPKKWGEFQRRYRRELNANPDALRPILNAAQRGNVALVYSSHDAEHNNAVVLKEYVEEKLEKKSHPPRK